MSSFQNPLTFLHVKVEIDLYTDLDMQIPTPRLDMPRSAEVAEVFSACRAMRNHDFVLERKKKTPHAYTLEKP